MQSNPTTQAHINQDPEASLAEVEAHDDTAEHVHLPPPSIWPVTTAAGVALAGMGLVSESPIALGGGLIWPISIAGVIIMIAGVVGWIQELRHEPH